MFATPTLKLSFVSPTSSFKEHTRGEDNKFQNGVNASIDK